MFIKSLQEGKTFTGYVVREFRDLIETVGLENDFPVLAQNVVNFKSEWRVFVLRREMLGIGHYKGNPLLFPDKQLIEGIIAAYRTPIVAYCVDVGLERVMHFV